MNNLGFCYHYGEGVKEDKKEAVKWYRKAADEGKYNFKLENNNVKNLYIFF